MRESTLLAPLSRKARGGYRGELRALQTARRRGQRPGRRAWAAELPAPRGLWAPYLTAHPVADGRLRVSPPPQIPGGSGAGKSSPCPACRARLPAGIRQVDPGGCTFLPAPDPLLLLTLSQSPGAPPVRVGSRSLSPPNYLPREVTVRILPGMRKGGLGSAQCHIPRGGVPT